MVTFCAQQTAPTAFHVIEVVPMERNTGANDLHVLVVVLRSSLAWAERTAVRLFEMGLLLQR